MAEPTKIFAPRPIKAKSNIQGHKINSTLIEPINGQMKLNCFTPRAKNHIYNNSEFRNRRFTDNQFKKENPLFQTEFLEGVERDFKIMSIEKYDNISKSEIISILNKSTHYSQYSQYSEESFLESSEIRISMPPIRPQNPFYKNFINQQIEGNIENEELCESREINIDEINDYFNDENN
jgi:hypothetical protein